MGARTAVHGGMYETKYLIELHYDGNPASAAYFCDSLRNVLKTYGASASQAILNAFSIS